MTKTTKIIAFFLFFLWSCGKGTLPASNDPAPIGTIVAQGQFVGLNGKAVSGAAVIYQTSSDGNYVVRIEGIVTPIENGLEVIAKTSTATVLQTVLRSTRGTQNYSVTVAGVVLWSSVSIFSTLTNLAYGTALLTAVTR